MIEASAIIAEAERQVGASDSEQHLHGNLAALVSALNDDARLNETGEAAAKRALVARSADRIAGLRWLADNPTIADEPIVAPVFLTGLPRSGTTYVQYLFDRDRRFRSIRTWESLMPMPPPGADPASVEQRKAAEAERRRQLLPKEIEGFAALHLIDPDGSDECHAFLEQAYAAAGFFNLYDVPSYFADLLGAIDLEAAYRVHKRQLQLLQWQLPRPRWALKYPNHVLAMHPILAVYPDARFVMTHRDPLQTLASIANMTVRLRGARYDRVDPHRVGRQMLDFVTRHIERIMAFCTGPSGDRVIHADYYALVADPTPVFKRVHAELGIDTPDDVREAIAAWRRDNPKGARGSNPYALDQFGIAEAEALERFGAYMRHFDIPREEEGLARAGAAA